MSIFLLSIGTILVFGRAINGEFLFDDQAILDMETKFKAGAYRIVYPDSTLWGGIRVDLFFHSLRQRRAITHFTYYWTWRLFGYNRKAWHGVSLAFHALTVLGVYFVFLPLLHHAGALVAAGFFGYHPHQTSAVAYVSGRAALQATFFTVFGLVFFQMGGLCVILSILFQLLAMKSKEDGPLYLVFYPIYSLLLHVMPSIIH